MDKQNVMRPVCAWCGNEIPEDDINIPIQASKPHDDIYICYDCTKKIYMNKKLRKKREMFNQLRMQKGMVGKKGRRTPSDLKRHLDEYIIGQDKAKETLSVAIYNHYKMLHLKSENEDGPELEKTNILLIGPTGSGKTAMLKVMAKALNVPFAIVDATSVTASGYVGEDPEICLQRLLLAADGDVAKAERGIVYIDEIDKIARKGENLSTTADPSNEAVQQALLKILEGSLVDVPLKGSRKHPQADLVRINTDNILFIVGGAFEGIDKIIAKRMRKGKASLGIGAELNTKNNHSYNDYILDVRVDDLKQFGMIPEFLGRLPVICPMQELSEEALISILTEPKNALLKQYQALFEAENVELEFTESALKAVAHEAMKRKTGARSLRAIMEEVLHDEMFALPDHTDVNTVVVDVDADEKFVVKEVKKDVEIQEAV